MLLIFVVISVIEHDEKCVAEPRQRRRHDESRSVHRYSVRGIAIVVGAEVVTDLVRDDECREPDVVLNDLRGAGVVRRRAQRTDVRDADGRPGEVTSGGQMQDRARIRHERYLPQILLVGDVVEQIA